ncbi:unnamed protein product [Cylicostephanus goldi]|uniref:PI3K/PI4K catalytic domain-containing protein n=1 Tax=Cylicostephanus goldi TaxID=71465 RepID=A0A3P7N3G4_CYLGO|nr:unnamed protein product [Cylicostephanus goldi]
MQENVSILRQAKILRRVPLPIVEQKICFPRDYSGDDLIKWESIERECIQADGISAPKVTRVKGSDGKLYKIIWKNDDVRQDCLVEQLFSIVNSILNNDEEEAFLRTYKDDSQLSEELSSVEHRYLMRLMVSRICKEMCALVTYVVGLGDRHLSNVLFELGTCKLVHIDLG